MPEEKKEKFTFSDKIKASKPAAKPVAKSADAKPAANKPASSKPFAKPVSKIGKDGKPRQTLFERTRRDAPFFIAALVALLLLPFLYKYSGQTSEEELIMPMNEENIFNPDHFGFNTTFTEDPEGQIAQFAGRDSLSLIRGLGGEEADYGRDDLDFDSSSAAAVSDYDYSADSEGKYAAAHHESSDMDIENNTLNVYKRRAKRGTRAAFKRAATKINTLSPATMRRGGGSPLGVKNWGGSLKNAAQKVKSPTPTEGPKPVSLQPLRAKSGRAAFGGTGKAGRASRAAMGKSDAREALRDANVKPVDPTRVGGLDMFSMGPGGGSGKLERSINIAPGKEPWWWDMMKTRMQKEWEKRFERKWKWIDWADEIAMNILKGLINCLLTGEDDGSMGSMFGHGEGGGKVAKCGSLTAEDWANCEECKKYGSFGSHSCKAYLGHMSPDSSEYKKGWQAGSSGGKVGFLGARLKCLGIVTGGYGAGGIGLNGAGGMNCTNMPNYSVIPSGEARKWNIYTYVVARNYFPDSLKAKFPSLPTSGRNLLCASMDREHGGSSLNHGDITGGVGHVGTQKTRARDAIIEQTSATDHVPSEQQRIRERTLEIDQESLGDACVIVVERGNILTYEAVKNKIIDLFKELGGSKVTEAEAVQAFQQLDLMFVSSVAMKNKLAYAQWFETGHRLEGLLPLPYWEFENAYIEHKKVTHKKDGSRDNVYKRKWRVENVDRVKGPICYYDSLNISCKDNTNPPQAQVEFKPNYKGGQPVDLATEVKNLVVTAQYKPLTGDAGTELSMNDGIHVEQVGNRTLLYSLNTELIKDKAGKKVDSKPDGYNVTWRVYRNASTQDQAHQDAMHDEHSALTATCTFNLYGDVPTPPVPYKRCQNAQQDEDCCHEIMGDKPHEWKPDNPKGSQCVEIKEECPEKENTSAKCCTDIMGEGYIFDPNHNPKCYKPETPPVTVTQTRLAPVLSWVPSSGKTDCRAEAGNDVNPPESTFAKCPKVPGIVKDKTQNCGSQIPMMMDSEAAAKFVKDVVTAYNNNLPKGAKKLSDKFYGNTYPTDGEFVDALFIAAQNPGGNMPQQVPAAAVCELGRDMVRMSRDPQVGTKQMKDYALGKRCPDSPYAYGQTSSQDKSTCYYTNDLGAFLAYVQPEAMFYPGVWVANNTTCDQRFIGVATSTGSGQKCPNITVPMNMHHNNYHSMLNKKKDAPDSAAVNSIWSAQYSKSLNPVSLATSQPLAALVSHKAWTEYALYTKCGINGYKEKCTTAASKYKREIEPLLTEKADFKAWDGNACKAFYGGDNGPMVPVAKALEYVKTVCSVGLDKKPHGIGGSSMGRQGTQTGGSHEGTGTSGTSGDPR